MKSFFSFFITAMMVLSAISGLFIPERANAVFNKQINYQGKLTDNSNVAVANGSYNIRFKLYTDYVGGSEIWSETWCYSPDSGVTCNGSGTDNRVAISSGLFSVLLGSTTTLTGIDFNQTLFLGVEIGDSGASPSWNGEMAPRKKLGTVPAAITAENLGGLNNTEFLRSDATNSTSTASTFLSIIQTGAGKIAEFSGSGSSPVLSLLSGGNVGVGTSSPWAKFSVSNYSAGASAAPLFVVSSSTGTGATSTSFIVDKFGNVGIGIVNPAYPLQVNGTFALGDTTNPVQIQGDASGAASILAGGSNQAITLTPSGTGSLNINSASVGSGAAGVVNITTTADAAYTNLINAMAPNLTAGKSNWINWGVDGSTKNAASLGFYYDGAGSDANRFDFALFGVATQMSFTAAGKMGIAETAPGSTLSIKGNASIGNDYSQLTAPTDGLIVQGFLGLASTSPTYQLSVEGISSLGNEAIATKFTATSTTATSTFAYTVQSPCFSTDGTTCLTPGGGASFGQGWELTTNIFGQSALAPTTTQNIHVSGIGTSTIIGGVESWRQIASPYFHATSSLATSTFAGGIAGPNSFVVQQNTGRLGVGTASPGAPLEIWGPSGNSTAIIRSTGGSSVESSGILLQNSRGFLGYDGGIGGVRIATTDTTKPIVFANSITLGSGELMRLTGTGRLGIGTTSPWAKLTIGNDRSTTQFPLFMVASSSAAVSTSTALMVDWNGNVGIGTTSPWAQLSVNLDSANNPIPSFAVGSSTATKFLIDTNGRVTLGGVTQPVQNADLYIRNTNATLFLDGVNSNNWLSMTANTSGGNAAFTTAYSTWIYKLSNNADAQFQINRIASNYVGMSGGYNSNAGVGINLVLKGGAHAGLSSNAGSLYLRGGDADGSHTKGVIRFQSASGNEDFMYLDTTGHIGIGSTTPFAKLSIHATSTETNSRLFEIASSTISATTTHFVVLNNGKVGVGTTSPWRSFSVMGSSDLGFNALTGSITATSTTATSTFGWGIETNLLNVLSTTATSTFANGIKLSGGCFMVGSSCLSSGGGASSGSSGDIQYSDGSSGFSANSNVNYNAATYQLKLESDDTSSTGGGPLHLTNSNASNQEYQLQYFGVNSGTEALTNFSVTREDANIGKFTINMNQGGTWLESLSVRYTGDVTIPNGDLDVTGNIDADSYSVATVAGVSCADNSVDSTNGIVTACGTYSDLRLKNIISPYTGALDTLAGLSVFNYTWNDTAKGLRPSMDNDDVQIGLSAQEVELVLPKLVTTNPETGFKTLNYGKFISPIIAALKEIKVALTGHDERIKSLETKLSEQQQQIISLQKQVGIATIDTVIVNPINIEPTQNDSATTTTATSSVVTNPVSETTLEFPPEQTTSTETVTETATEPVVGTVTTPTTETAPPGALPTEAPEPPSEAPPQSPSIVSLE